VKLEEQKEAAQEDISESETAIGVLREDLSGLQETLEEKTKNVEQVKKTTTKASKVLDQALKEIASKVVLSSLRYLRSD
jgi:structural maintenance of chromosome 1